MVGKPFEHTRDGVAHIAGGDDAARWRVAHIGDATEISCGKHLPRRWRRRRRHALRRVDGIEMAGENHRSREDAAGRHEAASKRAIIGYFDGGDGVRHARKRVKNNHAASHEEAISMIGRKRRTSHQMEKEAGIIGHACSGANEIGVAPSSADRRHRRGNRSRPRKAIAIPHTAAARPIIPERATEEGRRIARRCAE